MSLVIKQPYAVLAAVASALVASACSEANKAQEATDTAVSALVVPPEPVISVVRRFTCSPQAIQPSGEPIADVAGSGGELVIKSTLLPCQFDLVYRSSGGVETTLSASASGYLFAAAADRVACASPIEHHPELPGSATHVIDAVPIDCSLRSTAGTWLPMQRLVNPGTSWAAWISSVSRVSATSYTIRYKRDFSFQFMNVGNLGRPATDGVYDQAVAIVGNSLVASGPPQLVTTNMKDGEVEDPTPGCTRGPNGEIDPLDPACQDPLPQTPGQAQFDGTAAGTNIAWSYNMGYRFTPIVSGMVVALGGFYSGTKTVRLYEYPSGEEIASADHTSANAFSYTDIAPVYVTAGRTYVVAVDLAGSGGAYDGPKPLSQIKGGVVINCPGTFLAGSTAMPTNCSTSYYGMADIVFVPEGAVPES